MKRMIMLLLCALIMVLSCPLLSVTADNNTEPVVTAQSEADKDEEGPSRGIQIAGFLIIFTAAMGTTAYIVARPKLKMLKEIKTAQKNKKE